jgi:excinuclease ABC subunit A
VELSEAAEGQQASGSATDRAPATFSIDVAGLLAEAGFTRLIVRGKTVPLADALDLAATGDEVLVVVDRLSAGTASQERLADSLELAFRQGDGACLVLVQTDRSSSLPGKPVPTPEDRAAGVRRTVDEEEYEVLAFNTRLICPGCGAGFAEPEPALFNFNSPLGACPSCRGIGAVSTDLADPRALQRCPDCHGDRLRPEAIAVRVADRNIVELTRLTAIELFEYLSLREGPTASTLLDGLSEEQQRLSRQILAQAISRHQFLIDVGLGYLTLDRPARTLSAGEAQRVRLTAAFGSKFVNMLYVLDEPTTGLHPRDTERLVAAIKRLRDAGNTVVVVEHDPAVIREADQVVEIGPGAGPEGGQVVFQGTPQALVRDSQSVTGAFLTTICTT